MLLLLPDLAGGFSLFRVSANLPDSAGWRAAASLFTHAEWVGLTVWDMVMPVFVLLIGASLPLSCEARSARGESDRQIAFHTLLRSAALVELGVLLTLDLRGTAGWLMPYLLVLGIGLPFPAWLGRLFRIDPRQTGRGLAIAWPLAVLCVPLAWLSLHVHEFGTYHLAHIFLLVGLAYPLAFLFVRASARMQWTVAFIVIAAYGLAFAAYTPAPGLEPRGIGFTGLWSPWNNGTNLGAAIDRWLLSVLPHQGAVIDEPHGHHLLHALPLVATMLFGMLCTRELQRDDGRGCTWRRLTIWAIVMIAVGALLAVSLTPLVKSLWTPSWALVSGGLAIWLLALLHAASGQLAMARALAALSLLGSNSVLLYTIAAHDRWRLVAPWRTLTQAAGALAPLAESLVVLASLWGLAWLLRRVGVLVRL